MTFAEPTWFLLLIVIPLVVVFQLFIWLRRGKAWKKLVAERLRKRLVQPRSLTMVFIALGLAMTGFGLLVTALAKPEAGEEWVETRTESRNLLLCFDISQSMLTEDAGAGSRLDAAKAAALEVVERFPTDRIGLLIFSGETQVTVPLTIDHTFLNQTINQLNPLDLPLGGSNLARALADATSLLMETGQRNNVLIVLSDGEDHSSGIESAARQARSGGIIGYTLGFGSQKGDFIKDPRERDGYFVDRRGNRVVSQLKEDSLRKIAEITGGAYAAGVGSGFLGSLDAAVAQLDIVQQEGGQQRIAKPVYQWFLLPALLLLMSSIFVSRFSRSPVAAAALLATFASIDPASGAELSDIYLGKKATREGEFQIAQRLFETAADSAQGERSAQLHLAAGASAAKMKQWPQAITSFGRALTSDEDQTRREAHFALGNALFYLGASDEGERGKAWQGAVENYQASLAIEETLAARENLEALEELLKKEKEQEQEQEDEEKKEEKEEKEESEEQESDESESEEEQKEDGEEPENKGEQGEEKDDAEGQEDKPEDGEKGEDGEESQEEGGDKKDPGEESGSEGEEDQEETEGEQQPSQAEEAEESEKEETPEEQARRILNQQADFGGRPPTSRRRPLRRPEKDW